jgi:hypothetical protein
LCTSHFWALNIVGCCCALHFYELMCCFKLLVATLGSSFQAFEVVGYYAFHLLEFLLKLLIAVVHLTSLFLSLGFLVFTLKEL